MNKIKFSHEYQKFPFRLCDMDKTILLEVLIAEKEELSQDFVEYDTKIQGYNNYYALPNGKLIILILKSVHILEDLRENQAIFTTVRRWTPEKEKYYKSIRGKEIKIEVIKE